MNGKISGEGAGGGRSDSRGGLTTCWIRRGAEILFSEGWSCTRTMSNNYGRQSCTCSKESCL